MNKKELVGKYINKYNEILGLFLPQKDIFVYPGFIKHIQKRHLDCLKYIECIPDIILNPDYIGKHPTILLSVEFVKYYDKNILVSVQFNEKDDCYHVSSLYNITKGKIDQKLFSGRFKEYS